MLLHLSHMLRVIAKRSGWWFISICVRAICRDKDGNVINLCVCVSGVPWWDRASEAGCPGCEWFGRSADPSGRPAVLHHQPPVRQPQHALETTAGPLPFAILLFSSCCIHLVLCIFISFLFSFPNSSSSCSLCSHSDPNLSFPIQSDPIFPFLSDPIFFFPFLCNPIRSNFFLSFSIQFFPFRFNIFLSFATQSDPIFSFPIDPIFSFPLQPNFILSFPLQPNPIQFFPFFSDPIFSFPIQYFPFLCNPIWSNFFLSNRSNIFLSFATRSDPMSSFPIQFFSIR